MFLLTSILYERDVVGDNDLFSCFSPKRSLWEVCSCFMRKNIDEYAAATYEESANLDKHRFFRRNSAWNRKALGL